MLMGIKNFLLLFMLLIVNGTKLFSFAFHSPPLALSTSQFLVPLSSPSSVASAPISSSLLQMSSLSSSGSSPSPTDTMSLAVSKALGRQVELVATSGGGASGGGGATTSIMVDKISGDKYFCKSARNKYNMLMAEYLGVQEMADTKTIRVPTPIAFGQHEQTGQAFAIFEYLEFVSGGAGGKKGKKNHHYELGVQLAKMHRHVSESGFGFHVDNTIGATPQPNLPWMDNWADFWIEHRLGHMLHLTGNVRYNDKKIEQLKAKTRDLISHHNPQPSLLHGDLWGGNKGFCKKRDGGNGNVIVPVIFDPATYYGDREADIAMTYLFGGFNADFYKGYEMEWELPEGHEKRRTIYNLYHILNHQVLFGGSYMQEARSLIEEILRM